MSGQRPPLRGLGYMKKGGRPATVAHNEQARAAATVAPTPAPDSSPRPVTVEPRTDGRVSGRSAASRPDRSHVVFAAYGGAVGAAVALIAEALVR